MGEVCESFEYGLNASAKTYDGKHKYIRITDINENDRSFNKSNLTSPDVDFEKTDSYILKEGDLLFTRTGASVGKSYLYRKDDGLVYYAGFLIRARINEKFDSEFIFQNTLTDKYNNYISLTSQRSGQPGVNADEYSKFTLFIPKSEEQKKIGLFLSKLDNTIALHQLQEGALKRIKSAFLEKIFSQEIRFSGFDGAWEQRKLSDIADRVKSYSLSRDVETADNTGYKYIHYGDIHTKVAGIIDKNSELPNIKAGDYELLQENDVVVADASEDYQGIATPAVVAYTPAYNLVAGLHTIAFRPKETPAIYLYYLLNSQIFKKYGCKAGTGMKVFGISSTNLMKFETRYPSLEEQKKNANFFKQLDDTIALHRKKINSLHKLKQAYLRKMFL